MRLGYVDIEGLAGAGPAGLVAAGKLLPVYPDTETGAPIYDHRGRKFTLTNHCVNPKPVHTTSSAPATWGTNNATNSTYTYSDGGTYHSRTTKHIKVEGAAGCSTQAGVQVKDRVAAECVPGDYFYVAAALGEATLTGCTLRWVIQWFTSADALISQSLGESFTPGGAFAVEGAVLGPAPATADKFRLQMRAAGDFEVGDVMEYSIGEVIVAKANVPIPWADGDSADWSWTGTADASKSSGEASTITYTDIVTIDSGGVTPAGALVAYYQNAAAGYYGPIVVADGAYGTDRQAYLAAHWNNLPALLRGVNVGDWVFPMGGDSVGYQKLDGDVVPFDGRVLMVAGDSITAGYYSVTSADCFYGLLSSWATGLGMTVEPRVSGEGAKAAGIAAEASTITAAAPDFFVLEIGTNDPNAPATDLDDFQDSLETILDAALAGNAGCQFVMCTLWRQSPSRDDYDARIQTVATAYGATVVSLADLKDDTTNSLPAGVSTWKGLSDGWHPNNIGHNAIYTRIRDALEAML